MDSGLPSTTRCGHEWLSLYAKDPTIRLSRGDDELYLSLDQDADGQLG